MIANAKTRHNESTEGDLNAVADQCIEEADGDNRVAATLLEARVRESEGLRYDLTDPLISTACWTLIRSRCKAARRPYWSATAPKPPDPKEQGRKVREIGRLSLYDYWLTPTLKLGDAKKGDLINTADFHSGLVKSNAIREKWLRSIANEMKSDRVIVRKAVKEKRLAELQREAQEAE
jgi:hypothetical protein